MESLIIVENEKEEAEFNLSQTIQVLKDIKSLNETYPNLLIAVKKDYSEIKISQHHESKFDMEFMYSDNNWILTSHNLPDRVNLLKIGKPTTLKRAMECCKIAVENLNDFYEVLETIDRNAEVVEPRNRSSKDNWRIVKFNKNVYVKIELPNPMNIKDVHVNFIGKNEQVQKMTELYNKQDSEEENIYWKLHFLRYELEEEEDQSNDDKIDCGICLEYYDESDKCPLIFCNNSMCSQAFHSTCLNRHLKVSNLKILNVAVGECPFCKFKIQINLKENE